MAFSFLKKTISIAASGLVALSLAACHGILDDLYDQPEAEVVPAKGQLLIDATSWTDWYYVDLKQLQQLSAEGKEDDLRKAQTEWTPYPIPMSLTGDTDGRSGQYLYWFDVFGAGLSRNEFRSFVPCDPQPEPDAWSFAVHRNNVRTHGGAALRTTYTSMDQLLLGLVPSQGISINRTLSSWLSIQVPPMPPSFVHDSHVFILRLADGTYAALQLENYLSATGTKCWLTINYKYPY